AADHDPRRRDRADHLLHDRQIHPPPVNPRQILEQVPLAPYTTLGVGGPARHFVEAATEAVVRAALDWAGERGLPVFILGGGSNLVVADEGFAGLVGRVVLTGVTARDEGEQVVIRAGAGEEWDGLVAACVERGLAGIECLSGIPG